MESYDILANQPVVIDNVSMMMSFIHTQTEAAGWERLLTASLVNYCVIANNTGCQPRPPPVNVHKWLTLLYIVLPKDAISVVPVARISNVSWFLPACTS